MAPRRQQMNKWDKRHLAHLKNVEREVDRLFAAAVKEAAALTPLIGDLSPTEPLSLMNSPIIRKRVETLLDGLKTGLSVTIVNGVKSAWTMSNNKNNELSRMVFGDNVGKLSQAQYRRYFSNNGTALDAFLNRKQDGLNLSDRVWRYTDAFKREIELGLEVGIRNGVSAADMTGELRQWLQHPDMLFRRVRDADGNLQLSKRAAEFHPGRGVYRSSYKNARRLAATETNIAYRTADHERWQQLDFVVGIEICLSNNHTLLGSDGVPHPFEDICDDLAGRYPKDFKFTGWHPHCRCHAVSILKTTEEMNRDNERILRGEDPLTESENEVTAPPDKFTDWVRDNQERMERASSLPYFIKDNQERVTNILNGADGSGSQTGKETPSLEEQIKKQDKSLFTPEQVKNLKELETAIGVKRGLAMNFDEANEGRSNPLFSTGKYEYTHNCQCCAVTFEMRRRGFNVTATERTRTGVPATLALRSNRTLAWLDPKTGQRPTETQVGGLTQSGLRAKTEAQLVSEGEAATKAVGRYQLSLAWKSGGGHRISAERHADGTLTIYDPQTGFRYKGFRDYVARKKGSISVRDKMGILRTDNLLINPQYISGIVKKP